MSEEYGPDYLSLIDEDGREVEVEILDELERNGTTYYAMVPAGEGAEESEDFGLVLMKVIQEDGEDVLSTMDTEEEEEEILAAFQDRFFAMEEGEAQDADPDGEET